MQMFLDELAALHPWLPQIASAVAIIMAVIVAWIVASIPAHWIWRAVAEPLNSLSPVLEATRSRMMSLSIALFSKISAPLARFVSEHQQMFSFADENTALMSRLADARRRIETISGHGQGLERTVLDAQKSVKEAAVSIQRIHWPESLEAPKPSDYASIRVPRNDAQLRVWTFLPFAVCLIAINTFMLKEFFASFIPALRLLGISLPVIVAMLFSILEVAFGAAIAFVDGASAGKHAARVFLIVLVGILGLLEAGFYAEFGLQYGFNPFKVFWAPGPPPAWSNAWFGLFGPLVVAGMAWSGDQLFSAFREIWRDDVIKQYKRFLDQRTRKADEIKEKLDQAEKSSSALTASLKNITAEARPQSEALANNALDLSTAKAEIEAIVAASQKARLEPYRLMSRANMLQLYFACIFQAGSIVIAYLFLALAFGAFGFFAPVAVGGLELPSFAVALAETVLMIGSGYATARTSSHLSEGDAVPAFTSRGFAIGGMVAYAVALSVVAANSVPFISRGGLFDFIVLALTSAACLWLFVVGRRLGLILAAAWTLPVAAASLLACASVYLAAASLFFARIVVHSFLGLLSILEFPYRLLFRRSQGKSGGITGPVAAALMLSLIVSLVGGAGPVSAQQVPQEPQSTISVLVDLSATWLNPGSKNDNARVLGVVTSALVAAVGELETPVEIRFLPIGDLSLAREPMCEVLYQPKLLAVQMSKVEVNTQKKLQDYLTDACIPHILARKQARYTDISGAFDSVSRMVRDRSGKHKSVIALSDFKEERRPNQKPVTLQLRDVRAILMYRVLEEDRFDTGNLDARLGQWTRVLNDAGARANAMNDLGVSAGLLLALLTQ